MSSLHIWNKSHLVRRNTFFSLSNVLLDFMNLILLKVFSLVYAHQGYHLLISFLLYPSLFRYDGDKGGNWLIYLPHFLVQSQLLFTILLNLQHLYISFVCCVCVCVYRLKDNFGCHSSDDIYLALWGWGGVSQGL